MSRTKKLKSLCIAQTRRNPPLPALEKDSAAFDYKDAYPLYIKAASAIEKRKMKARRLALYGVTDPKEVVAITDKINASFERDLDIVISHAAHCLLHYEETS